jgi:ubiquinone/menaquinone biosynthesis C-methylase UbiE
MHIELILDSYTRTMDEKKAGARRWFDRRAGSYESGVTSRWRDPIQRASVDALDLGAEDRLLVVGCGTGAASRAAASIAALVVGIDLSREMLRQARDLAEGIANVHFEIADSEHLPFEDGAFTAVLCSNSFHHYPNPRRAVREMTRVLAPRGRIVVGDACSDLMPLASRISFSVDSSPATFACIGPASSVSSFRMRACPGHAPEANGWRVRDCPRDRRLANPHDSSRPRMSLGSGTDIRRTAATMPVWTGAPRFARW